MDMDMDDGYGSRLNRYLEIDELVLSEISRRINIVSH